MSRRRKDDIPRHPVLTFLIPSLGPVREPTTKTERLIEFIDSEFMFDGFPGFEEGVLRVQTILAEYRIDIRARNGRAILRAYVEHAVDEMYGDFERWTGCGKCGQAFQPKYSLEYANHVLNDTASCRKCASSQRDANRP